ncbi:glutaminase A [uncultured Alistipes sp.]|uniref:glutaminase A n=1 Tax=uncultured Alistipes sp. TaxID=538949 RepID=UPI00265CF700|nr:glutaminase A [uncultured Alistipes sp.]
MIQKIDKQTVRAAVEAAYDRCKEEQGGKNADYIPYLAGVPSTLFGIAACLPDGDIVAVGDTDYVFGIESVSKVPTAILAMNQYGAKEILDRIGADATGLPFNSIMALLLEKEHPSTPLVNAGAISACSMIRPTGDADGKWRAIVSFIADLTGSEVEVIDELYRSETATNFNNKSIAWLLKNYARIYDDPELSLDLYTRQCSLGVTARQLAVMAATIASGGVNPLTRKEVFKPGLAPKITSMMATVGFYEHTGDWLFTTGLPAKTGVGGGIMGVVPGVMGLAAFAPPLDEAGNSVKAQRALAYIAGRLNLGVFGTTRCVMAEPEPAPQA